MSLSVHFSSETDQWATPPEFFAGQNAIYRFELDVCADASNAKCGRFFTKEQDGLEQPWSPYRCWMNPPYGRGIGKWLRKAFEESERGALVVCLIPARTDTSWWHDYAARGEVSFIRGRLKFGGHSNSAPFPSALVVFKPSIPTRNPEPSHGIF